MEKLAYSIKEAMAATGLGRSTICRHIWAGHLPTVKIGGRNCITAEALRAFITKDWPIPTGHKKIVSEEQVK